MSEQAAGAQTPLHVTPDGYVIIDGVKVFRYIRELQALQFLDKDRKRSAERGDCFIYLPIEHLPDLIMQIRCLGADHVQQA